MKKSLFLFLLFVFSVFIVIAQNRQWSCGDDLEDNRDGKSYKTVLIGNQCWMAENLNYGTMINSTKAGGEMTDNTVVEKYCWDNVENNCDGTGGAKKLGAFYEWSEAVQEYTGQPALHVQGVCPAGWHIPSRNEYNQLMTDLGGSNVAGGKMKEGGESGFEGILTGYRCTMSGSFRKSALGTTWSAYYWASEQSDATNAYFYELNETNNIFNTCAYSPFTKSLGNSIRCIENTSSSVPQIDQNEEGIHINQLKSDDNKNLNITFDCIIISAFELIVYDISGKLLIHKSFDSVIGDNNLQVDLNSLSAGIYLVEISNGQYRAIEKFSFN